MGKGLGDLSSKGKYLDVLGGGGGGDGVNILSSNVF
jgi:hypothetical protein